jgi:AraC-like DNA-binding protein
MPKDRLISASGKTVKKEIRLRISTLALAIVSFLAALILGVLKVESRTGPALTARQLVQNLKTKSYSGERVELRFEGAGLAEILGKFEEISDLKFEISPSVDVAKFPAKQYNFLGYPWDKALDAVLSDDGLELRLAGGELRVDVFSPAKDEAVSAFLVGTAVAAVLSGGTALFLGRRRRRRRNLERERKISLSPEDVDATVQRLNYLLQIEKVHRNARLSLDSLSERLSLQPHQLSGIVNSRLGKTFTDLVADCRIEDVKKRLSDPGETANILNIAYDAGFGTKASFNRIFKGRIGLTPSEFKKRHQRPDRP